jgi:hypothetical protein
MGQSPWLWAKSESKYFRFYEVTFNGQNHFKKVAGSKDVLDEYYNSYLRK